MTLSDIINKVGDKIIEQDLSANAMENITTLQIKAMNILPKDFVLTQGKFDKIKKRATARLKARTRSKVQAAVNSQLEIWLHDNYPTAVTEHREDSGKPIIEIWYEGKPAEDKR